MLLHPLAGLLCLLLFQNVATDPKVQPGLLEALADNNKANVIVEIKDPSTAKIQETIQSIKSINSASANNTRTDIECTQLNNLINQLQSLFLTVVTDVLNLCPALNVECTPLWMASSVYILDATEALINILAAIDIVVFIRLEDIFPRPPVPPANFAPPPPPAGPTIWNLDLINARCDQIRGGCLGNGVIVGIIDSGVLWDHQELKDSFQNDDFSWWNGYNAPSNRFPEDDGGHGTHVLGTVLGKNVGVAPYATWKACKGCAADLSCTESALLECMEFMAAPWRYDDTSLNKYTKDACKRPHVIVNSWGGASGSQMLYPSTVSYYKSIDYWKHLGILSVFAAGNRGPGCGSLDMPGSFLNTMSAGAVDKTVTIAGFSARGPGLMAEDFTEDSVSSEGGSCSAPLEYLACTSTTLAIRKICEYIKPDVVAPGVDIVSSWNTGKSAYVSLMGTSMAAPHVTGLIALMLCNDLNLRWDYENVYRIVRQTADVSRIDLKGDGNGVTLGNFAKGSNILCNFFTSGICNQYPVYPNNLYGKGLANACKAVEETTRFLQGP